MPTRSARTLAALALAAGLAATAPAHAGEIAVDMDCSSTDHLVLPGDDTDYLVHGTCFSITITGSHVGATIPNASTLRIVGDDVQVSGTALDIVEVEGDDARIESGDPIGEVRITGDGATVRADTIFTTTVKADRASIKAGFLQYVTVRGSGSKVLSRGDRSLEASVRGHHNVVRFDRLDDLVVRGHDNRATVRRGATKVRASGARNVVRVHRRS
jgi:hypothetical protein